MAILALNSSWRWKTCNSFTSLTYQASWGKLCCFSRSEAKQYLWAKQPEAQWF